MKNYQYIFQLGFLVLAGSSCEDAKITYGGTNCDGAAETTETFSRETITPTDLGGYDYLFEYTNFTLGTTIENACPSKPLKLNFSCHLEPVDSLPVFVSLSVYSGFKTLLGPVDLSWDTTGGSHEITGSGEFSADEKSEETSFQLRIEYMVPFSDVTEARNYLIGCFKGYTMTVTYFKLQ